MYSAVCPYLVYYLTRVLCHVYTPASTKLKGGYTPCPSIRLWTESCPLCIFNNDCRIHFIFPILSSNFRRCAACKAVLKMQQFEIFRLFKICNVDFVLFRLGIQYESIVWVIMRRQGSSERRRGPNPPLTKQTAVRACQIHHGCISTL